MFRLFKAELKKIFLKPSIFVVTGLLIFMLAVSAFLYKPQSRSNFVVDYNSYNTQISNQCDTVKEVYDNFNNSLNTYSVQYNKNILQNAEEYITYYANNGDNLSLLQSKYQTVFDACADYQSKFNEYKNAVLDGGNQTVTKNEMDSARDKFFESFDSFYNFYKSVVSKERTTILVTDTLDRSLYNFYNRFNKDNFDRLDSLTPYEQNKSYLDQIQPQTNNPYFINTLKSYVDQLIPLQVDEILLDINMEILSSAKSWIGNDGSNGQAMTGLYKQIFDFYQDHKSNDNPAYTKEMIKLVTDYNLVVSYADYIVTESIKINGLEKLGATNIQQFANFKSSNLYQMQEKLAKLTYLFNMQEFEYQYADVFSINQPSNDNINGFDYSYFALRLCTLFIIVYVIVLAAGTIAGEQSSGTMKLLAIRPFSRYKLLAGKMLAIFAIGAILLTVSSVATLVIGGINYGFASLPMLVVADASIVIPMSNIFLVYLLAAFTMFLEIIFYASVSIFISTMFKSNIGAVTVSILLFFVSLVLNIVAINVPILRFLPFTNVNIFKYFGASFIATNNAQSVLQGILTPSVFVGANLTFSYIYLLVTISILEIASFIKFKKQDIK